MFYVYEQFGTFTDFRELADYVQKALLRLEEVTHNVSEVTLEELHEAPEKFVHGKLYFADGTDWDPGSGRGVYLYDSTGPTWRFLG